MDYAFTKCLKGKAQEVYSALSLEDSSNYEKVKDTILKAYELVPEAYRQKFRNYRKQDGQTYVEFAREKQNLFERWCHSKEIGHDFEKLKELVILEEFKNTVQTDIETYLYEQKVNELEKAAVLADDFALTHKHKFSPHFQNRSPKTNRKYFSQNSNWQLGNKVSSTGLKGNSDFRSDNQRQKSDEQKGNQKIPSIKCAQCGRKGHISSDCFQIVGYPDWHPLGKRTDKPNKGNPVGLIGLKSGLSVDQLGCL